MKATPTADEDSPLTLSWRFVTTKPETAHGYQESPQTLQITHSEYLENSYWEGTVHDIEPGTLVRLTGQLTTEGPCQIRLGENFSRDGASLSLETIEKDSHKTTAIATHTFYRPFIPGATSASSEFVPADLALVLPEGSSEIRLRAVLSGEGSAQFLGIQLTATVTDAEQMNAQLIQGITALGAIKSRAVETAFRNVLRHHFLPEQNWGIAYRNDAIATHFAPKSSEADRNTPALSQKLPISSSSQPSLMAIMLEQLQIEPGMRVLEIGAGTGYNAALLSQLTGSTDTENRIWTVDLEPEFCQEVRDHLQAAGVEGIDVLCADGWKGYAQAAPYDRIIVTASAYDIAPAWFQQLRPGGRLVVPLGSPNTQQWSTTLVKEGEDCLRMVDSTFCGFMQMRGQYAWTPSENLWQDWLYPNQPPGMPATLVIYPKGTAPKTQKNQRLVERRWFDYLIAWE